jgi:glutaredoxin 3
MNQMEITIYAKARSPYGWLTKRLLKRRGYDFEVVEVPSNDELPVRMADTTVRGTVPQVFVAGRLVGGFEVIRTLDRSGDLDRLVRGDV